MASGYDIMDLEGSRMPSGRRFSSQSARLAQLGGALLVVGIGLLAGCQGSPSIVNPQSPQAGSIANLTWIMIYLAVPILVLMEALILFTVLRFRSRAGRRVETAQIEGHRRIEIIWTAA